jgi:hypothetical protein
VQPENTKGGSITVPLTSCLTGLESPVNTDSFCFYSQNRQIQTSQTGGQWYKDTFHFSIPRCSGNCSLPSNSRYLRPKVLKD